MSLRAVEIKRSADTRRLLSLTVTGRHVAKGRSENQSIDKKSLVFFFLACNPGGDGQASPVSEDTKRRNFLTSQDEALAAPLKPCIASAFPPIIHRRRI